MFVWRKAQTSLLPKEGGKTTPSSLIKKSPYDFRRMGFYALDLLIQRKPSEGTERPVSYGT